MQSLQVNAPQGLMDLVWAPAQLEVKGKTWSGYLPARYPLPPKSDEPMFKTGLKTTWQQQGSGRYIGQGRKMWISNTGECSLFEAGKIQFDPLNHERQA
ncbi:type VI secretion system accessory protein TagJ [Serratia sp. L9]|uniref:type VI secretion system accessory protein TagJ n=1 Tax=Serratia sp. L9 TaxID=3423946 RepID=UPI003D670281